MAATFSFFSAMRFAMRALRASRISECIRKEENDSLVFRLLLPLVLDPASLECVEVTAALETNGSDQSLNFGSVRHNSIPQLFATAI